MKLETLSKAVEDISKGIVSPPSAEACLEWIINHNALLMQFLALSQFVPCRDGVPLENKFSNFTSPCSEAEQKMCGDGDLSGCECYAIQKYKITYAEAEKLVIFEGWTVELIDTGGWVVIVCGHYQITFSKKYDEIFIEGADEKPIDLKTIYDLANATEENPLTLKS